MKSKPHFIADSADRFVDDVFGICDKQKGDKGTAAALRRADNPDTEYQSWDLLSRPRYCMDLTNPYKRIPFATIGAAIAKSKATQNGEIGLGRALYRYYQQGENNKSPDSSKEDQAKAKLLRLLACQDVKEACRIIRPLLSLLENKDGSSNINYKELLKQLLFFNERTKEQWAENFYRRQSAEQPDKDTKS